MSSREKKARQVMCSLVDDHQFYYSLQDTPPSLEKGPILSHSLPQMILPDLLGSRFF
jgi:hypothetical protein